MPDRRTPLAEAALLYAASGWAVLPLQPGGKEPLTKAQLDLSPEADGGHKAASRNPVTVASWWERWPEANIGVVPGRAGLLVVDVDGPEGHETAAALGLLAEPAPRAHSGRPGGLHFWFRHPAPGCHVPNMDFGSKVDLRADGGYIVVSPSRHPNGRLYRWQRDSYQEPPDLPPALQLRVREMVARQIVETFRAERSGRIPLRPVRAPRLPARGGAHKGFTRWRDRWTIGKGDRNEFLISLAGRLRWQGLSLDTILRALHKANRERCRPPLPDDEVERVAASVMRYPPGPGRRRGRP